MLRQLGFKTLMSVLIIGEIMTIFAGIMSHMNTEEIILMIGSFAGIWIVFFFVSMWTDSAVNG